MSELCVCVCVGGKAGGWVDGWMDVCVCVPPVPVTEGDLLCLFVDLVHVGAVAPPSLTLELKQSSLPLVHLSLDRIHILPVCF